MSVDVVVNLGAFSPVGEASAPAVKDWFDAFQQLIEVVADTVVSDAQSKVEESAQKLDDTLKVFKQESPSQEAELLKGLETKLLGHLDALKQVQSSFKHTSEAATLIAGEASKVAERCVRATVVWGCYSLLHFKNIRDPSKGKSARSKLQGIFDSHLKEWDPCALKTDVEQVLRLSTKESGGAEAEAEVAPAAPASGSVQALEKEEGAERLKRRRKEPK